MSIRGDQNTKYFHGIINKKHNQLTNHGIFSNEDWIDELEAVKKDFYSHFKN